MNNSSWLKEPPRLMRFKGVDYKLPRVLPINGSFFIPTLTPGNMFAAVREHYQPVEYKLAHQERIENSLFGIRVWRVL